jgi:hypothetical protein
MIKKGLSPIQAVLGHLKRLDSRCVEAHIEENDYTIYTYDDLEYAFNLAKSSVDKKLDFIQNQVPRPLTFRSF